MDNLQKKLRNRSDPHHLMSMNILPGEFPAYNIEVLGWVIDLHVVRIASTCALVLAIYTPTLAE